MRMGILQNFKYDSSCLGLHHKISVSNHHEIFVTLKITKHAALHTWETQSGTHPDLRFYRRGKRNENGSSCQWPFRTIKENGAAPPRAVFDTKAGLFCILRLRRAAVFRMLIRSDNESIFTLLQSDNLFPWFPIFAQKLFFPPVKPTALGSPFSLFFPKIRLSSSNGCPSTSGDPRSLPIPANQYPLMRPHSCAQSKRRSPIQVSA